jgi:hypothetical protein
MNRAETLLSFLTAVAKMQQHISVILEVKALEAEKARIWTHEYMRSEAFIDNEARLNRPMELHEQINEVIDGLARLESSFARNLQVILEDDENTEADFSTFSMFGSGDNR